MEVLNNIGVILLYPKKSGNVGSTARVMKNFGINNLSVVSRRDVLNTFQAKKMAVHADDLLKQAKRYKSLKEATSEFSIVIGTTGKFHKDAPTTITADDFNNLLLFAKKNKIGFLFGPEDRGLSGEELSFCNYSLTIPTSKSYPSLNLSQAVGIVAYDLFTRANNVVTGTTKKLAKRESFELLYEKMKQLYLEIGFLDRINPERVMKLIRNIYDRAFLEEREIRVLLGIIKQTNWYIKNKR